MTFLPTFSSVFGIKIDNFYGCKWFDSYYYFKLKIILSQEGNKNKETGEKKTVCINIRDLSYNNTNLYDSTFLSYAYEEKKNKDFKDLDLLNYHLRSLSY